jgi:two-component system chemotaxis response regulator CheY
VAISREAAVNRNMKILVVDDFSAMRRIIRNFLHEPGISNVEEADGGSTALLMRQSDSFDFLVTDWNMPAVSGLELVKAVRGDDSLENIPIPMVTALANRQEISEAVKAGVNGYVVKPFTAVTLRENIEKIFARRAAAAAG